MFYMHVPKTGGTSIIKAMCDDSSKESCYSQVYGIPEETDIQHLDTNTMRSATGPIDHLTMDERSQLGLSPVHEEVLCTIREPLSRFISEVRFRKTTPDELIAMCENPNTFEEYTHCRPQTDYTHPNNESICSRIVDMNRINLEAPEALNVDNIERHNTTQDRAEPIELTVKHLDWICNTYEADFRLLGYNNFYCQ